MATHRFDIEIRDLVARSIRTEIEGIRDAARGAHASLRDMRTELSGQTSAASSAARATNESARASAERARQGDAAARAMQREAAAADALASKYAQQARAARSQSDINGLLGVGGRRGGSAAESASVFANTAPTAAMLAAEAAADKAEQAIGRLGKTSRLSSQHAMNLGFQLNDVAVSLMSGQKPLTVFVQQGAQIGQIASQAGVGLRGMAAAAWGLVAPFLPLVVAVGATVGAFALLTKSINDATSADELTRGLGLTKDEIKELEGVTVTMGDTVTAVFEVIGRRLWERVGGGVTQVWETMQEWYHKAMSGAKDMANFLIGTQVGGYRAIMATWRLFPAAIGDIFLTGVNASISAINLLVSAAVEGVNGYISQANKLLPEFAQLPEINAPQIALVANQYAGAARTVGETYRTELAAAMETDYVGMLGGMLGRAWGEVRDEAIANARERLQRQADEIIDGRSGGSGRQGGKTEAEKRAEALDKINRELDGQIALLGFYGPALERENRFLAINNQLRDKGITLTGPEEQSMRERIRLIQEGTRVQEALNRIEEQALGGQRDYDAQMSAINIALRDNIILEGEAARQRNLAATALVAANDPLREYNEQLRITNENLGLYGQQLAVQQRAQELFNAAVAAGVANTRDNSKSEYEGTAREQIERERMNQVFADIDPREQVADTNAYVLDNYAAMYAEIARLREEDLISEQEAAERKKNVDRAHMEARLETTSSMLGQISQLQTSKNRELAALGKAAAIAQATIDGVLAVQAALKGPPGPPWSYAIAGVTGAMAAVNVAKIAGVGFMSGGYTGNMPTNQVAGAVHGQEYVFDAEATRRIGVPALEAMRNNSRLSAPPANDNGFGRSNIRIIQGPGTYVEAVERSDGEIEVIAERVARRVAPKAVADDMQKPNGATGKAMGRSFGLKRADR